MVSFLDIAIDIDKYRSVLHVRKYTGSRKHISGKKESSRNNGRNQ